MLTKEKLEEIVSRPEYDFLRTNPRLKDKILFLTVGGSYAYGTNVEGSDIDIRGVAMNSIEDILGGTTFEQFQNEETDTVIYSVNKFIKLVTDCNPNVIELLFCEPEQYIWVSPLGQLLLDNKHLFLSQKAYYTFGGYARAQLNRLENALCRGNYFTQAQKEEHIARSVENSIDSFGERYSAMIQGKGSIKLHTDKVDENGNRIITTDMTMKDVPLREIRSMLEEMTNIVRDYDKSSGWRNTKKDIPHLNKHIMHLVRLYYMGIEILETGTLHTYRSKEHQLLMSIRNGLFLDENNNLKPEFYTVLNDLETKLKTALDNSQLPKKARRDDIMQLQIKINLMMIKVNNKTYKITLSEVLSMNPHFTAIHCDTEEKANKLLNAFDKLGKKWCGGGSYISYNNYENYKDRTCYSNNGGYSSYEWHEKNDYIIYEFDEVDLEN